MFMFAPARLGTCTSRGLPSARRETSLPSAWCSTLALLGCGRPATWFPPAGPPPRAALGAPPLAPGAPPCPPLAPAEAGEPFPGEAAGPRPGAAAAPLPGAPGAAFGPVAGPLAAGALDADGAFAAGLAAGGFAAGL